MSDLPITTKVEMRPVYARVLRFQRGEKLGPPTDEEKHDAIRLLTEGPQHHHVDSLSVEALRILDEAGR